MKFAVLALIGAASAQQFESELTENVRKTFSASALANAKRQLRSIEHTLNDLENEMEENMQFTEEQEAAWNAQGEAEKKWVVKHIPAYMKNFAGWVKSEEFQAAKNHKYNV